MAPRGTAIALGSVVVAVARPGVAAAVVVVVEQVEGLPGAVLLQVTVRSGFMDCHSARTCNTIKHILQLHANITMVSVDVKQH